MTDWAAVLASADGMDDVSRRGFLKLLGASMALAGVDGCTRMPAEKILPYVNQPPEVTPGVAIHFATAMALDGYATGLIVESHEGRPTKIEGNPLHPASLGASSALQQASLLQLYDPDRGRRVLHDGRASTWADWASEFAPAALRQRAGARGAGFHLLLEPTGSPTVAALLARLRAMYPDMGVHFYSPAATAWLGGGSGAGSGLVAQYDLTAADVIVCFDADVLASSPFSLRYARQFADGRRRPADRMNRLYVAESAYTCTGMAADDRLRCRLVVVQGLLEQLHAAVRGGATAPAAQVGGGDAAAAWLANVVADVREKRGRVLVIAGDRLGPQAQVLAADINAAIGSGGSSVWYTPSPLLSAGDRTASIATLADALDARSVEALVCIGGNPAYRSPGALQLANAMRGVKQSAYVGLYADETSQACHWYVPLAHYLESWGDERAYDGTLSVVQPLIQPLFGAAQPVAVLGALSGAAASDPFTTVRDTWRTAGLATADEAWETVVRNGVLDGSAYPRASSGQNGAMPGGRFDGLRPLEDSPGHVDVIFAPDARVHDGSFSNNAWLQELPDPITKLTWGNAALVSPTTARQLGVETGDVVTIERAGGSLRIPVIISPGQADSVVALSFGYGRSGGESVARGFGANAYAIWPAVGAFVATDATVRSAGAHRDLAITQTHWSMEARDPAQSATLAEYQQRDRKPAVHRRQLSLYPADTPNGVAPQQWAMTIDLGTCTGCSACVVACQAENNIPVVGPDDVRKSREMHWLRIDRYLSGSAEDPEVSLQPMLCQQCEKAPCEYVCPVGATTHSADGLNEMVYNRCVGTRFCSNNCPYKVRRFNWFDYNAELAETERMAKNPDVTVRERGVMEKCTFCVQRIREAEISAQVDGRPFHGSDIITACAQACPTRAIVFGSLTEPDSEMMKRREEPRVYSVLDELGTEPRVQYLARIRNARAAGESHA